MGYRRLVWFGVLAWGLSVATGGASRQLLAEEAASGSPKWFEIERIPLPTLGGSQFWTDLYLFHEWRIQQNALSSSCRLLDGNNLQHAFGTYEKCRGWLEQLKAERNLAPMQGKVVLALHGLGRSRSSMVGICKYLEKTTDYRVLNVEYASTRRPIDDHAQALAGIIAGLDSVTEINFVAHSLGNIVIRYYLADQTDEATGRRPDPRIKRFVMLGPPNHGSVAATAWADNRLFATVAGTPGQELGCQWEWLESRLATPDCQFAIVAGGLDNDKGFNPMLPGDDDGVVTVTSTYLAGAEDFMIVPMLHTLLPSDPRVWKSTRKFLEVGTMKDE